MSTVAMPRKSYGLIAVAIVCAACMVYYHLGLFVPQVLKVRAAEGFGQGYSFGADFYPIWLTAREGLLEHRDPYSPQTTQQIQIDLFARSVDVRIFGAPPQYWTFAYPAFADVLFWPLALLPFSLVRVGFALILATVTVFSIFLWLRALRLRASPTVVSVIIALTLSSYPVLEGLFAGQLGLLVGFLLAASLAALARQRLFFSGTLLALALLKPQTMVLIAAYLLLWSLTQWRSRWQFVAGFSLMSLLLGISSLLVWPRWIPEWLQVVRGYRQYSPSPLVSYLLGNQIGPRVGPILILTLVAGAIVLSSRMRRVSATSAEFGLTVSLLLAITTIAIVTGQAVYDHVMLLPGVILIALSWRSFSKSVPFRVILCITALAVFWQWIAAPLVIATRPILSDEFFRSAVLTLPIRTAASIPFGVCALLGLMMWQGSPKKLSQ